MKWLIGIFLLGLVSWVAAESRLAAPQFNYPELEVSTRTWVNTRFSRKLVVSTETAALVEGNLYILNLYK